MQKNIGVNMLGMPSDGLGENGRLTEQGKIALGILVKYPPRKEPWPVGCFHSPGS